MKRTLGAALLIMAAPAAADCPTGLFRATAGPDTVSLLEIGPNGHFRYALSEGAVDEQAEGRWACKDGVLRLTTEPTPRPAEFRLDKVSEGEDVPFALIVTWPDGQGVPLVDFRLEMDGGEPVTGYTQSDGWSRDLEGRMPRSVQVAEPFYGTVSPVFPLPARTGIKVHIVLTPNDMGTADFRNVAVTREGGKLVLHWRDRAIPYDREEAQ